MYKYFIFLLSWIVLSPFLVLGEANEKEIMMRDIWIRKNIKSVADQQFPDNLHNIWGILSIAHQDEQSVVEAKPTPKDVGYDQFKFVLFFVSASAEPQCIGVYCYSNGKYSLLSCLPEWENRLPVEL